MNTQLIWIRPPWRNEVTEECWPWVGDQFIAAVLVHDNRSNKLFWEYAILSWSETGLECAGEPWGSWDGSDIEWIAKIPEPLKA